MASFYTLPDTSFYKIPDDTKLSLVTPEYYNIIYHIIPCHAIPCYTMPQHYHTIPYHTVPYHTIPYHNILMLNPKTPYNAILPSTILYHAKQSDISSKFHVRDAAACMFH